MEEVVTIADLVKQQYGGRSQTLQTNSARTSELVGRAAKEMARVNGPEKIPLNDIEMVKAATEAYLIDCAGHGIMPTVRGCASFFGVSRNAVYDYARKHPGSAFSEWLDSFSDLCGELLMQAAVEGTASPVPAIFIAKSRYGWRENDDMPLKEIKDRELTPEEIAAKWQDLPE